MCLGRVPSHDPDYCWFEKLTTPKSMAERCKVLIGGDFGESRTIQGYQNIKMRAVGQNRLPIGTIRLRVSFVGVRRCIRRRSRSNRRTVEMRTQDGLGRPPSASAGRLVHTPDARPVVAPPCASFFSPSPLFTNCLQIA